MSDTPKSSRRDQLTATTDENKIELTEEELSRVAGGTAASFTATTKDKVDPHLASPLAWKLAWKY